MVGGKGRPYLSWDVHPLRPSACSYHPTALTHHVATLYLSDSVTPKGLYCLSRGQGKGAGCLGRAYSLHHGSLGVGAKQAGKAWGFASSLSVACPAAVPCLGDRGSQGWVTCFMMRRERMFMTKPPRRGYMVRDWMTVLMSSMGRGLCSISCCITTASTSDVYTFRSAKHRLVAARRRRVGLSPLPSCPLGSGSPTP